MSGSPWADKGLMRRTLLFLSLCVPAACAQDVELLVEQLDNKGCGYSVTALEVCRLKPWLERAQESFGALLWPGYRQYECPLGAARCLEKMGRRAAGAAPALMKALREGPSDFDTGDGVIAVRSGIAAALAATGDSRAIGALAEALRTRPGGAETALLRGLGSFGAAAGDHWELAAALLRARNGDPGFRSTMREHFEYSEATAIALDEIKRAQPGRTSYQIPHEAVEKARGRMDRGSPQYARDFELRSADHRADAAAWALGRMGRREAAGLLAETLRNPHAAAQAAWALGELGSATADVVRALETGARSAELGPRARGACLKALGRLQAAGSLPLLREMLTVPSLMVAAATALEALGPAARPAVPDLQVVAGLPSLAVRQGNSIHFPVEATERQAAKAAARRAILAIEGRVGARSIAVTIRR